MKIYLIIIRYILLSKLYNQIIRISRKELMFLSCNIRINEIRLYLLKRICYSRVMLYILILSLVINGKSQISF